MDRKPRAYIIGSAGKHDVRDAIARALESAGFSVLDPQLSLAAGSQWAQILGEELPKVDLVVADVDAGDWGRYELGLAHGMRKPTILLIDRETNERVPDQLTGLVPIIYRSSDPDQLEAQVARAARLFVQRGYAAA